MTHTITPNFAVTQVPLTPELVEAAKEIMAAAKPAEPIDPKYVVTAEFTERPKAEVMPLMNEWRKAKKQLDAAKAKLENAERKIKEMMDGAEVLVVEETQQYVVESRVSTSQVFDTARFRKEQPDVAAQFLRTRYSRSFRILV